MNRKKKVHAIFKKKLKKAKARLRPPTKPKYINKAERARLESEQDLGAVQGDDGGKA